MDKVLSHIPFIILWVIFGRNIATLCEFLAENEFELWSQFGVGTGETSLARSKGTPNVPKCSSN